MPQWSWLVIGWVLSSSSSIGMTIKGAVSSQEMVLALPALSCSIPARFIPPDEPDEPATGEPATGEPVAEPVPEPKVNEPQAEAEPEPAPDDDMAQEAADDEVPPKPRELGGLGLQIQAFQRNLGRALAPRAAIARVAQPAAPVDAVAQVAQEIDPNQASQGALDELDPVLVALADLKLVDDRLTVSRVGTLQEFQQALYSNAHQFGGGGSSASGNGQVWTMAFQWTRIQGWAQLAQQGGSGIIFEVNEVDGLRRQLHYEADGMGKFDLSLWTPSTPQFLHLYQEPSGPIQLTMLDQKNAIEVASNTLTGLLRKLPSESRANFLNAVRRLGLPFPPTPYDPSVMAASRDRLAQQIDPVEQAEFRKRIEAFDADDFDQRQQASDQLTQEFARWRTQIEFALEDDELSLEARSRLREIYQKSAEEFAGSVQDTISDLDLLDSPDYLLLLVSETDAEPSELRAPIFSKLRAITGETLPDELEPWQAWKRTQPAEDLEDDTDVVAGAGVVRNWAQPFVTEGRLERLAGSMGKLGNLVLTDGNLSLNTEIWRAPFGDRTIAQVNTEIKQTIEDYQLPPSLWQGEQLEALGDAAYPVSLLMRMEREVQALPAQAGFHMHQSTSYQVTANPQFSINGVSASLTTSPDLTPQHLRRQNGAAEPAVLVYHFAFQELAEPQRQLRFGFEPTSQRFHVAIREPAVGMLVALAGSPSEGWVLQQLRDGKAIADQASTVDELVERNPEVFQGSLGKGLSFFGVSSPWSQIAAAQESAQD